MKWLLVVLLAFAPQDPNVLRVAWGTVRTVDPALAIAPQDVRVVDALFGEASLTGAIVEDAAITFKIPDLKWSDGRPVAASDYRFAWLRCLNPSTGSPWAFRFRHIKNARAWHEAEDLQGRLLLYENEGPAGRAEIARAVARIGTKRHITAVRAAIEIEKNAEQQGALVAASVVMKDRADLDVSAVGIQAVDAKTLRVTLEAARPGFPALASTTPFLPVPEHVVAARRDQWTHPDHIVTCGPYGVERWTRDGVVLAKSGKGGGPDKVALAVADRVGDAWPLYERGSVDWIDRSLVPPEKIESLAAAGEIRSAPGAGITFLRLNPATKAGLRRAVALAIDRAALLKQAGPGSAETRSLVGGAEGPARDLAAAMTALSAEFPDLKTPRLRLLSWKDPAAEEVTRAVRDQLEAALALSIRIDLREGPAYQAALAAGEYDLAVASFAPEEGDPLGILDLFEEGRKIGEKPLIETALAVPLLREGDWFVAKPRVIAKPGVSLTKVMLRK